MINNDFISGDRVYYYDSYNDNSGDAIVMSPPGNITLDEYVWLNVGATPTGADTAPRTLILKKADIRHIDRGVAL